MYYWLYVFPLLTAIIGGLTHYLTAHLLINRLTKKSKTQLSVAIGEFAANEFSQSGIIEQRIKDPANLEQLMPLIEKHIDEFLNVKLKEEIPMIGMFIGNKTTDRLKDVFIKELQMLFPQVMSQFVHKVVGSANIATMVSERVNKISPATWKSLVKNKLSREIRLFILLGILSGLLMGLIFLLITHINQ